MNIFFTVNNATINLLDNPYFQVKAYIMNDTKNWYVLETDELKFGKCSLKEIGKYTGVHNVNYFKNSVCL